MMKGKIITFFIATAFLAGLNSYAAPDKEEKRSVGKFNALGLAISADVEISQGSKTELILVGDPATLKHIKTVVEGGKLKIKYDTRWPSRFDKVKITITSPDWEEIAVSGSGTVRNVTPIQESELSLAVSGSGLIKLNQLLSDDVSARISGSGDIQISGSKVASNLHIAISGSGDVDASEFKVEKVTIKISGSGDASVYAESRLEVAVSGSGDVSYSGNASVDARISGSGNVKKLN